MISDPTKRALLDFDVTGLPLSDIISGNTYEEFSDVVPITIRNAGLLLREANEKKLHAEGVLAQYKDLANRAQTVLRECQEEVARAEYRLKISALQPNGGEE